MEISLPRRTLLCFALVVCWRTQAASFARAAALPEGGTLRAVLGLVCGAKEFERAAPLRRNQKRFLNEVRHGRGRFTTRKKDRVGTAADKARVRRTIAAQRLLLPSFVKCSFSSYFFKLFAITEKNTTTGVRAAAVPVRRRVHRGLEPAARGGHRGPAGASLGAGLA